MRLDHVAYACSPGELGDTVQRLGQALGAAFVDGGKHPRFGTRNFVLPLPGGVYVEVVAALDHPAAEKAPFGCAVRRRAEQGGGWLGWAVSVDDLAPIEARLGRAAVDGHRTRPDGLDLRWRQIGILELLDDPQLPFFVCWEVDEEHHPSANPTAGLALHGIEMAGDPAVLAAWLDGAAGRVLADVEVTWVDEAPDGEALPDTGIVAVTFATPHGPVRID